MALNSTFSSLSILCIYYLLTISCFLPIKCNSYRRNKYNVVFIVIDDLRYLPETDVKLPNLQKLAAKSITFQNAYAQQALCAPSRNSFLTGRRPDALHLYDFYSYWRKVVGNFTTLPQFLKDNGYDTFSIGKIFHPGISSNYTDDFPYSWSNETYHPPTEKYKDAPVCLDSRTKKLQRNLLCPVKSADQPGKTLPDIQSLNYAMNFLKKRNEAIEPFLLAIGFYKPHIPLKYPKHYLRKVPISKVNLPKFPKKPIGLPLVAWHPWTDIRHREDIARLNISFPFGLMPNKWTLKIRQSYYAAAKYVDDLIGDLLKHVNMNNTIVVLTSDHGWSLGENGLWAKYSNFDVALNVPLLFSGPGLRPKIITTPVELIDIFPTITDLLGLSHNVPKCRKRDTSKLCFDGESLVPLMQKRSKDFKGYAISQCPRPSVYPKKNSDKPRLKDIKIMGYSIRTKRYRYTEWLSFNNTIFTADWSRIYSLELYDHIVDPNEAHNMYMDSKYQNIINYLSNLLRSTVGFDSPTTRVSSS